MLSLFLPLSTWKTTKLGSRYLKFWTDENPQYGACWDLNWHRTWCCILFSLYAQLRYTSLPTWIFQDCHINLTSYILIQLNNNLKIILWSFLSYFRLLKNSSLLWYQFNQIRALLSQLIRSNCSYSVSTALRNAINDQS